MKPPFEQVIETHGLSVLRVCRSLLDEHRAQDAWSETFLAALKAYPELDQGANIQAWLVRIAHHKAIDEIRRHPVRNLQQSPTQERHDPGPGPEAGLENLELWRLVRLLPDKQRLVVAYRYLADLDYQNIAQILGGTPESARRAATDGIRNLRKLTALNDFMGENR